MNISLLLNQPPRRIPRLCGDIINIIIDFQWTDEQTLHACSLVGHDWLHRSQTHLLRRISLRNQYRLSTFVSELPTMSVRVRHLIHFLRVGDFTRTAPYGFMHISRKEVILLLDYLPRLDELELRELQLLGIEDPLGSDYVPRSLDTLSFMDVVGPSFSVTCPLEIVAFIGLFCRLRKLTVDSFWANYRDATYPTTSVEDISSIILQSSSTLPYYLQVENVHVGRTPLAVPCLHLLRLAGTAHNIRRMFLTCFRMGDLIAMHDFLYEDPSKLESLHLDFIPYARLMAGDVLETLNWQIHPSRFKSFHDLLVRINFDAISLPSSVLMWQRMLVILDHFSMTRTKSLYILITAKSSHPPPSLEPVAQTFRNLDWSRLDQIFRQYLHLSDFPCVRVHDLEDGSSNARRYVEIILYRLPLCRNEGRVRLEWFSRATSTTRSYTDIIGSIGSFLSQSNR